MSGHSKWATTHRQKSAADAKKGAAFTKMSNLIAIAAREGGADQNANFKLRLAIEKARAANMPKDKIEKAILRGAGIGEKANLEEAVYEVLGPAGSAFIIEVITDNKNRAISEIKNALIKNGGQLAGSGNVSWLFNKMGVIIIALGDKTAGLDELELSLIDAGAQEIVKNGEEWEIRTMSTDLQKAEKNLRDKNIQIKESSLSYVAKEDLNISDPTTQEQIERLFSALSNLDDVSNVYTNANW
ncbi:MAG: YebC/PmpR family DNA-binding transcriptional regulator [Patescibacteria group bacterium]